MFSAINLTQEDIKKLKIVVPPQHTSIHNSLDQFLQKNYEFGQDFFVFTLETLPNDMVWGEKHVDDFRQNFYIMADTILNCAKSQNVNVSIQKDFAQFDECTTRASRKMFIRWRFLYKALSEFHTFIRGTDIMISECLEYLTIKRVNKTEEVMMAEASYCIGEVGKRVEEGFFDHTLKIYKESYLAGKSVVESVDIQATRCVLDGIHMITATYKKKYQFDINECLHSEKSV